MLQGFQDLELIVTRVGSDAEVSVSGDVDLASAAMLRRILAGELEGTTGDVAVDLSNTSFCDTVGLEVLLSVGHELEAAGRTLRLIDPSTCVIRLLQLTASTDRFVIATR